jgi:regulator of cell morphogenesis and NO signaling
MTPKPDMTIRDIVAADFRAAAVFQRHGIDFCCRGNRSVDEACRNGSTSAEDVLREVSEATASSSAGGPRFDSWDLGMLVSYIVSSHHAFVRRTMPVLLAHTAKVAAVHGDQHPELREVAGLFERVAEEMTPHMGKEEQILFPYIAALADADETVPSAPFVSVRNPIRVMEAEHEFAGNAMARIRELTSGYAVPPDACTTYRVCLQELEEFERDLHEHVHLENNILFPKATRIEAEIR